MYNSKMKIQIIIMIRFLVRLYDMKENLVFKFDAFTEL